MVPVSNLQEVVDMGISFMESLDTAISLSIAIMLRSGEIEAALRKEVDPEHYCDSSAFSRDYMAVNVLKKIVADIPGISPEDAALTKWLEGESQCAQTNSRLRTYLEQGPFGGPSGDESTANFFRRVKRSVVYLVGREPPEDIVGRFGPGATVSDRASATLVPDKMSSVPTLTHSALGFLVPWTGTLWACATAHLGLVPKFVLGNEYFQVPKNALTKRSCAKEPSLNGFYQLGASAPLRRRLKNRGIDLERSQDVHKRLARAGSLTGSLATIDLRNASDTNSTSLMRLCWPRKWLNLLASLRSPTTLVGDKLYVLSKFSSMGNGFTFEVETVVFLAICMATCSELIPGKNLWVYGDDIILPADCAELCAESLQLCGFTINTSKSFWEGPFRESCGGEFFLGDDVTPLRVRSVPSSPREWITLHNQCLAWEKRTGNTNLLRSIRMQCLSALPTNVRACKGPVELGDLVLWEENEARWRTYTKDSIRFVRAYTPIPANSIRWGGYAYEVQYASCVYGVSVTAPNGIGEYHDENRRLNPRGGVSGYRVTWVPFS